MKIVLDTNVFTLFGQGVDVFSEIERAVDGKPVLVVPDCVVSELERLAKRATKDGKAARLGFMILQERLARQREPFLTRLFFPTKEIALKTLRRSEKHADDAILAIAEDDPAGTVVATLDKGLQGRLLKAGVRVLTLRQKRFIIR